MKKGIHPENYRFCVFKDVSNGYGFLVRSCSETKDTIVWEDGKEYPLVKMEISNLSHPFFTGKMKLVDTAGRVDKFMEKVKKMQAMKDKKVKVIGEEEFEEVVKEMDERPVNETESPELAPKKEPVKKEAVAKKAPAPKKAAPKVPAAKKPAAKKAAAKKK